MVVRWLRGAWAFLNRPVPRWVYQLVQVIAGVLMELLKGVAKEYIGTLEAKIIEMGKTNYSNDEKFLAVWKLAHDLLPAWKESEVDTLVQNLYFKLKKVGRI